MNRRRFLKDTGSIVLPWVVAGSYRGPSSATRLLAMEPPRPPENPDWTLREFKPTVEASTYFPDPPGGYDPSNVFSKDMHVGWQAFGQREGAWLKIQFPQPRAVQEIWILGKPIPRHGVGEAAYMDIHPRTGIYAPPRQIRCTLSEGQTLTAELRDTEYFQIVRFPDAHSTTSVLISVEGVWTRPGVEETGIGKVKIFPHPHEAGFEIDVHPLYDARNGQSLQSATLHLINPGDEIPALQLIVSKDGVRLMDVPLDPIPGRAVDVQYAWIPAPFEDATMEFKIAVGGATLAPARSLRVPAYRCYFDGGEFAFNCMSHNDLGWLDTQEKTADYRCAKVILPAVELLEKYPEFRTSMESTVYMMEFLDRYPEKREAIAAVTKDGRFGWGASYVQCQEGHVGPEKLVRQFYLGRRWLKKNFPGADTRTYFKTDPPTLTLQMPQILAKAGIKYLIQGRMPFGYYWWQAPDGSSIFTYGLAAMEHLDPKGHEAWLEYAADREPYYAERRLPPDLMFDYWTDYLAPQPDLPPYVREQNAAMQRFADVWNNHYRSDPKRQVDPPRLTFAHPEEFLDELTKSPLNITTLSGDWPCNWVYYDEPGHRRGLLAGRLAHNRLLTAERIYAGLSLVTGFQDYPQQAFDQAWRDNLWPDHGWGGNKGPLTDDVYVETYEKSKRQADDLLEKATVKLARTVQSSSGKGAALLVFNPLTWDRTDIVNAQFKMPSGWSGFALRDDSGMSVPCEIHQKEPGDARVNFSFIAEGVASLGYRRYHLEPSSAPSDPTPLSGETAESDFFKLTFGSGGIKSLYDKRLQWEVLQTSKFDAGEVLQFTAPGFAFDDKEHPWEDVGMKDFDKTSHHPFPFKSLTRGPIRTTAVREAVFEHFRLRETFHLYHSLDRVDIELEVIDWDGQKERELRVAFPINLSEALLTYEVPFGKVEVGKDELDFSLLPSTPVELPLFLRRYGGDHPMPFREAINWIDASSPHYLGNGCLAASNCSGHLFRDDTDQPAPYPVLQHVLLSTRKSIAWNPFYWFTQKGTFAYRMSLLPHHGDWRVRYRDGIGFNYPLVACISPEGARSEDAPLPAGESFFRLEPANLVLTALKKSEDDDRIVIRFYEAEGFHCQARLRFLKPVTHAWATNLIEEEDQPLALSKDASVEFQVKPWEIVTLKVAV